MKTNHILQLVFAIITGIAFAACEGETTYSKKIANQSTDTLTFKIYSHYPGLLTDSFSVLPGGQVVFWNWSKRGGTTSYAGCREGIDSMACYASGGSLLLKDFLVNENWEYSRNANRRGSLVDHYCTFTIQNSDLGN